MSKDKKPPISMRLEESVVEVLQKEARRISFETDTDVSYVDLIRDSVENYIKTLCSEVVNPVHIDTIPRIHVKEDMFADMDRKELLRHLGIDLDNPVAKAIAERICKYVKQYSLGRRILLLDEDVEDKFPRYKRDVTSIAHIVARRGAVPDQIVEGDYVVVPPFEIACYPTCKVGDILAGRSNEISVSAVNAGIALVKEENSNVITCFKAAAIARKDQVVEYDDKITIGHLETAFGKVIRHDLVVETMICNSITLINIQQAAQGLTGDWEFKIDAKNPTDGGHFRTAKIYLCDRAENNDVIFGASPASVGVFSVTHDPIVATAPDPHKLRVGFFGWETVGIGIINDWAVSLCRKK